MANTKLDVYNLTLFYFGHARRIEDPTETSTENRILTSVYDQGKESLLTMAKWGFTKSFVQLTLTEYTPTGWLYEYLYPQGCLKAIEIAKANKNQKPIPFQTGLRYVASPESEKKVILTNEPNAELIFTRNIQNVAMMTPTFVQTLAYYLAIPASRVLAKDKGVTQDMIQMFQFHFNQAIIAGEAEAQDEPHPDATWITEAYGGQE